jgi:hypothetical protein
MMCSFLIDLTFPEREKNGCLQSGYVAGPLASGMYSKIILKNTGYAKSKRIKAVPFEFCS